MGRCDYPHGTIVRGSLSGWSGDLLCQKFAMAEIIVMLSI